MARRPRASIAGRVFALQSLALLLIAGVLLVVLVLDARRNAEDDAASTSLAICRTIAVDPQVRAALASDDPSAELQPFAVELLDATRVDFVTIMRPDGTRLTHPDPARIGQRFLGTITAAQRGEELTETYTGTLGPSVRAVVPIEADGAVIGIVSAGVTTERVSATVLPRIPFVLGVALAVVLVGTAAAYLLQRGLRRMTGGMRPDELESMVRYYESVLHSVREGLVLTDARHRVVLYNDEAADLLGLPAAAEAPVPATAAELGVDAGVAALLDSGRRVVEESHVANGTVLLVNQEAAVAPGAADAGGTVMTLRDQSALQHLVGELESVRTLSSTLRSQAHEHANAMHTVVSLLELGRVDEAIELASRPTGGSQLLADELMRWDAQSADGAGATLAALLLGKTAQAHERGVTLRADLDATAVPRMTPATLVSVVGNLLDNAIEAALRAAAPRWVELRVARAGPVGDSDDPAAAAVLEVRDSGAGVPDALRDRLFDLGVTTKDDAGHGFGLAIVRDAVTALGGTVELGDGAPTTITLRFPATVPGATGSGAQR